jgi:TonB family protein
MTAGVMLLVWTLAAGGQVTVAASDDLSAARALYAAGDYEAALTRLDAARTDGTTDEVDQYRALCYLALGRTSDTENALRELVARRPLFRMSEADVSPRLVAMFHAIRQRMLPGIIRDVYNRAKTDLEAKRHAEAASNLRDMLELIGDADVAGEAEALADLRLLGQGFLKLAELELAAARAEIERAAEAARAANVPAPPPAVVVAIYSDADAGIVAPVAVSRPVPPWRPPNASMASRTYRGHLRVIVDEAGRVESASLIRPFLPGYDQDLEAAARTWQFRPATKDGVAVKYVKLFTIDVSAR